MTDSNLGIDLGRLFEVGFNIGILTYIEQNQLKHNFGKLYRQDLQQLSLSKIVRRLANQEQIINQTYRQIIEKWCLFFLQKSFLSGLNFFGEYLQATGWKQRRLKRLEILYYQCSFCDDNSIGTYNKNQYQNSEQVLSQFGDLASQINIPKYSDKGEFLNADTLILIRCDQELRIMCLDYSVFSIKSIRDLADVDSVEVLRSILLKEISYLKSKSVFANLGLDTKNTQLNVSESLQHYYTAFKRSDKETVKLIQAASYAYSFANCLRNIGLLTDEYSLIYHLIGYSDRSMSSMTLNQENSSILATCSNIYKNESKNQSIQEARQEVLTKIKRSASRSFNDGKDFIEKLLNISEAGITTIIHQERISNFTNTIDKISNKLAEKLELEYNLYLRQAHAELIKKALASEMKYIFLTGNPGIGKTTAISEFLKSETCLNEGFLLFYVSPRTQVNLDIIEKFRIPETQYICDDRVFTINTNATLITSNNGKCTVHYLSNQYQDDFIRQTVHFIDQRNQEKRHKSASSVRRVTEDQIQDVGQTGKGVLNSICQAIYTLINQNISHNIVATVAIQALKKTQNNQDTLAHFEKIFKDFYNSREGKVNLEKMKQLSRKIKHIFIMIDEITGDDSGVEFLSGITRILNNYGLTNSESGFNTKIIIADASIVDPDVIKQHLSETSAEPNKIFFRKAISEFSPLSVQPFQFRNAPAVVINANSYPAKNLDITYKIMIESVKFTEKLSLTRKFDLEKTVQNQIIEDINFFLDDTKSDQIIVYIQDKGRLADLIEAIQSQRKFEKQKDYLEIHASLSELEKKQISQYQNQVKVIFMTASASRGLSFPKARHILADIPRFEIEKNLMEIIQVIYRGRGNYRENGVTKTLDTEDKQLIFYLSEQAIYYPDQDSDIPEKLKLSLQESILSLLNMLLILKASIMTRIVGYGNISQDKFMMIPIGGKSLFSAGNTFSSKMSNLIKQLKKEANKHRHDTRLKEVATGLEYLLKSANFILRDMKSSEDITGRSYLELRELLTTDFPKKVNRSFEELLDFSPIQTAYISGSMLVVPIAQRTVEEIYRMRFEQDLKTFEQGKLLNNLREIRHNAYTPENLCSAIDDGIDLVYLLEEQPQKTQRFEQNSQYEDQYYLLPLFTFISGESMGKYFVKDTEEPEDLRFRDILEAYIRAIYPVGDVLPIGYQYQDFPFLLFRSYSLKELRTKVFTDKYFLTSNELNVLNLILYQDI
jgi:hypothetical protein